MTTEYMIQFRLLAEKRNFLSAAAELGTTQASLSRHIMAMEAELGCRLLERSTRNVELTIYGQRFLCFAEQAHAIQQAFGAALEEAFGSSAAEAVRAGCGMKFDHIRHFLAAAEAEEFRHAAAACGISPSVMTKHMTTLESEIGFSLFKRTRRVELSLAGEVFLPYAKQFISLQDRVRKSFSGSGEDISGEITVAMSPLYYRDRSRKIVDGFTSEHPSLKLNTLYADNPSISGLLLSGRCDMAFIRKDFRALREEQLVYHPFSGDRLAAVFMKDHPLAEAASIDLSQLRYVRMFIHTENMNTSELVIKHCRAAGFDPDLVSTDPYSSFDRVKNGEGILLYPLPEGTLDADSPFTAVPVEPKILCETELVLRREPITDEMWTFLRYAIEQDHKGEKNTRT